MTAATPLVILIGEQGNLHQAKEHKGLEEVEERKDLRTAKIKGRRKRFGGWGQGKPLFWLVWLGLSPLP